MTRRLLGGELSVSPIGLGCMGMSFAYGGLEEKAAIKTIHKAIEAGIDFLDTAEVYGPYENEILVGKAIKGFEQQVKIATKFGFHILPEGKGLERMAGVNSKPEHIKKAVEGSLKRLNVEKIDLLYQHRIDPTVPVEDVIGAMAELVKEGKVLHLGLSEISPQTLRKASQIHKITAVQSEYSLWTRDPEQEMLQTCEELNVGFVPYSPLGRGFLSGKMLDSSTFAEGDFRHSLPRFQREAMDRNFKLLEKVLPVAERYDCTLAQLSLAWVLNKGDYIVPIPGARQIKHLEENVASAKIIINLEDMKFMDDVFSPENIYGLRYTRGDLDLIDS